MGRRSAKADSTALRGDSDARHDRAIARHGWEHRILRLLAEQGAVPLDQLARFLACDADHARRVADHLGRAGYVEQASFLFGEPEWVWLTSRGARGSGTGFAAARPKVGAIDRLRALNEVRLLIARRAPAARWIGARSILREQGKGTHLPNAIIEIHGERHAILVQLRTQGVQRLRAIIETQIVRYDVVIAFCAPRAREQVERLAAERDWPTLVIRDTPVVP